MARAVVLRRVRSQQGYSLVFEDWLFHTGLPFLAYAMVLAGAITLQSHTVDAEFGIASSSVMLLFIGIHNAWDTVTFIATETSKQDDDVKQDARGKKKTPTK